MLINKFTDLLCSSINQLGFYKVNKGKREHKTFTPRDISDSWRTPSYLFQWFNKKFNFDMDVCASDENHLVDRYFTIDDDALSQEWGWVNFANIPYSQPMPWIEKAIEQKNRGKITVMLVPADPSTKWFKLGFDNADKVIFISGRISFIRADTGEAGSSYNKGSCVFVFGKNEHITEKVSLIHRDDIKACHEDQD